MLFKKFICDNVVWELSYGKYIYIASLIDHEKTWKYTHGNG